MLLHASKLHLLPLKHPPSYSPSSSPPPSISSLLFEPASRSLALLLSDASLLLYPSLSAAPTAVPPASTAAAFLRLLPAPSAPAHVVLLSVSPHAAGATLLLRAWALLPARFARARLSFKRDRRRAALALPLPHGHAVHLAASANVLVLHSLATGRIWVMAAKADADNGDDDDDSSLSLVKCAVIECTVPIYSIAVSMGFLLLGEVGGVRAFLLRPLIKRRPSGAQRSGGSAVGFCRTRPSLPNGLVIPTAHGKTSVLPAEQWGAGAGCCNGGKGEGTADGDGAHYKVKTLKLRQTSGDLGSFFVFIGSSDFCNGENGTGAVASPKAVSIHALSQKKFLVLDSVGQLHILSLNDIVISAEGRDFPTTSQHARVYHLDYKMKVQMLAVLPDISARPQVVWMSDGRHSVHMMSLSTSDSPVHENEHKEETVQLFATQTIFTSEKVEDIVPLAASAILVLGQGNLCWASLNFKLLCTYTWPLFLANFWLRQVGKSCSYCHLCLSFC